MIKNYFYLIVGVLCLLFAVTHTLNGITTSLQILDNSVIEDNTKIVFTYVWHIVGVENLVFGIALLVMAFQKNLSKVKFATWLIIMILAMRWVVITLFTLLNNSGNVMQIMYDAAAIFVVIILLLLGTKVKEKSSKE
jgi:membrane associated rhomboid family serine protease